jgi:hypothetical protein
MKLENIGTYYESILDKEVRKEGGVYYTPPYIVDYIVENTVGQFLAGKTPKEVAKIKIVDPACGAGIFLLGAYQYLLDWHEKRSGRLTLVQRQKILIDNIFGVDIDSLAVEITKYCLSMKCSEGKDFTFGLDKNICCGNSLVSDPNVAGSQAFDWQKSFSHVFKQGGFDIVIGNPPYVSIRTTDFNPAIKPYFKSHYKLAVGQYDLYALFIERAEKLLADGGRCGVIVSKRMATNENFQQLRQFYQTHLTLESYVDAGMPFAGASVEANMLVAVKKPAHDVKKIKVYKLDAEGMPQFLHTVSADVIGDMPFSIFPFLIPPQCLAIIQTIQSANTVALGSVCTIIRGFECGFNNPRIGKRKTAYPIIRGEHVHRYSIAPTDDYVRPDFRNGPGIFKTKNIFLTVPKLITKFVSNNLQFALDTVGYCNTNVLYNVHVHKETDIYFLLGLLNSKLLNFWFKYMYVNDDKLFPHIQKNQLESIPILSVDSTKHQKELRDLIVSQAKNLLRFYREKSEMILNPRGQQIETKIDYCEDKINAAVYALYGLTAEEIAIIEGAT